MATNRKLVRIPESQARLTRNEALVLERLRRFDQGEGCFARLCNLAAPLDGGPRSPRWVQRLLKALVAKRHAVVAGSTRTQTKVYLLAGRNYSVTRIQRICRELDSALMQQLGEQSSPLAS